MSRRYSGRFSKLLCLLVCFVIGFSFAFVFSKPQEVYAAGAHVEFSIYDDWGDGCNFDIKLNKFDTGAKVTVKLECPHEIGGYNIWAPSGVSASKESDQVLYITFTYNGTNIQGQVTGSDITNGTFKANIISYEAPKSTNTPTPTPTNTPTPTKLSLIHI